MNYILIQALWFLGVAFSVAQDRVEEARFLGFLHSLQYEETEKDLRKLIPDCPLPVADVGADNTQIIIRTKLFGYDSHGKFSFHKGILVSHGFEIRTGSYKEAHKSFMEAVSILNSQVAGLTTSVDFPFGLNGADPSDGPRNEISACVGGVNRQASYRLRLDMRPDSTVVRWGAQRISD
ncbi:MAG: hypothetical protein EOP87_25030 [Verrucomicrobiaceae bacterium]|nr:MAG: hypothetical protein EOP87_25030 [Verrucomicrobiaceae bacterium]